MHPRVYKVKGQWRMNANGRMQAIGRLPGTIANPSHILALHTGWVQWHNIAIAGNHMTTFYEPVDFELYPFQR